MSRTIRIRNHPVILIAAALLTVGSAAAVAYGPFTQDARNATTIDVPYIQQGSGPAPNDLTPVDREAAQLLAELRAQRAADLQCYGMAYPPRPC